MRFPLSQDRTLSGVREEGGGHRISCDLVAFFSDLSFPATKRDKSGGEGEGLWLWIRKHFVAVQLKVVIWSPDAPLGVRCTEFS